MVTSSVAKTPAIRRTIGEEAKQHSPNDYRTENENEDEEYNRRSVRDIGCVEISIIVCYCEVASLLSLGFEFCTPRVISIDLSRASTEHDFSLAAYHSQAFVALGNRFQFSANLSACDQP